MHELLEIMALFPNLPLSSGFFIYLFSTHGVVSDSPALVPDGVLVDGDHVPVGQDLDKLGPDVPEVVGHDEGRGQRGPHRHLDAGLLVAQTEVADNQLEMKV